MTSPEDRTIALRRAYDFLTRLAADCDVRHHQRSIRTEARQILVHFPGQFELLQMAREHPMLAPWNPTNPHTFTRAERGPCTPAENS